MHIVYNGARPLVCSFRRQPLVAADLFYEWPLEDWDLHKGRCAKHIL